MAKRPLVEGRKGKAPVVHARLVSNDFDRLTKAAEATGLTRSQLIRKSLVELLDRLAEDETQLAS